MNPLEAPEQSPEALDFAEVLRESIASGIIAADDQGYIRAFDSEAERLTGLKAAAVMAQPVEVLPAALAAVLRQAIAGERIRAKQVMLRAPDGTSELVVVHSTRCSQSAAATGGTVLVLNNLTAIHRLGWNMQRLDRLASIGTLSASMAHEIKNALVAVNTFTDDLLQRNKDSELASLVGRELRRIDSIVSQMLRFAGPAKPTFTKISLHRILDQALRLVQPQLEAKQIRLRRSFTAQPDNVDGDDYQLEQAFINLLLNATSAMDYNGQLGVETELLADQVNSSDPSASFVQVTIRDSGVGIPPENLPRLFEPFFTTKAHGTGLGLAITRRIVLEHRGRIKVESESGKGTAFIIHLPVAPLRS